MDEDDKASEYPRAGSAAVTVVVCLLLAVTAGLAVWWITSTEPEAERTTQTRQSAMLVEVVEAARGTFRPRIVALGRVEAAREIELSPRVGGEVIARADSFSPGGFVDAGTTLLEIDPADYRIALRQRSSELQRTQAELEIEMGRQRVAESDLALLGEEVPLGNRALALRAPQLHTARAMVESAEAAVARAQLDLERTTITAPFDVQVLTRHVDVGSQVAPGQDLGRLVGLDTYWVMATVPLSSLPRIAVTNGAGRAGSPAEVRDRSAWPPEATRTGRVERLIGTLDEQTRLARLLVTVDDPLARRPEHAGKAALILGSIVEVTITGKEIADVVRLDRAHLRANDAVWLMTGDGTLRIAEVEVVFRDAAFAYVSKGLETGDRIVTSSLATVAEGAPLRVGEGGDS